MRTPDEMVEATKERWAAEARGECMKCPDCGAWIDYEEPHDAEPDTNTKAWNGGFACSCCDFRQEREALTVDEQRDAALAWGGLP